MPRFVAIALPSVRLEIARGSDGSSASASPRGPLAVVIARLHGSVKGETSLLGNTRLDEVSREAFALGVRAGQTIAAARARTADLRVRVVHVNAVVGTLATLAEMALAFGAGSSFEAGGVAGDVVFCDVTGCTHLHANTDDPSGERTLAARISERVRALGHANRVAIAEGPRIAAAVACFAPMHRKGPLLVPPGKGAAAMRCLPIAAFPLDHEAIAWLDKVGVRSGRDLARLPRASLGTRLGAMGPRVMQLLDGDDRERLAPYVPPEVPEERAPLEYGIDSVEALVFVVKRLCDRMALRLAGRCHKALRLDLELRLDRALLERTQEPTSLLTIALPSPLAGAEDLLRVLSARLASYAIEAPILEVVLRARELVVSEGTPLDLLVPEARAERTLPRLGAELLAELGEASVGTLALCDSWLPEERAELVPLSRKREGARSSARETRGSLLSGAPEPSRFLRIGAPYREEASPPGSMVLLEKIEAVQWWKIGPRSRHFFAAWTEDKQAMAWIEVDRVTGEPWLRGWMD